MIDLALTIAQQISDQSLLDELQVRVTNSVSEDFQLRLARCLKQTVVVQTARQLLNDGHVDPEDFGLTESNPDIESIDIDAAAPEEARVRLARKDYSDTLYHLEKALGRDFIGLSDLVLERRS